MRKNLKEIAEHLNCGLVGDGDIVITALAPIDIAKDGDITFVSNPKYLPLLKNSGASAFIVSEKLAIEIDGKNLVTAKDPYFSFAKLLTLYHKKEKTVCGIDKNVFVGKRTRISERASIYPNVYIGENVEISEGVVIYPGCFIGKNVTLGNNTLIYPNVVIREDSIIGKNVIIHSGTVIGSDGFGYAFNEGRHFKIPQVGKVIVEDNVEIGANTAIDRAAMGATVIGEGTKIDNLVHMAHNVKIGKNCAITGQVGFSGSAEIGDYVMIGGQSGIAGHLKVGDNVTVASRTGVTNSVTSGETVAGFPAVPISKWRKAAVLKNKLPDLRAKLIELEKRIKELESLD